MGVMGIFMQQANAKGSWKLPELKPSWWMTGLFDGDVMEVLWIILPDGGFWGFDFGCNVKFSNNILKPPNYDIIQEQPPNHLAGEWKWKHKNGRRKQVKQQRGNDENS
jgi:hypothetical protein